MCYSNSNTSQLQAFKDRYKKELQNSERYAPTFFASGFTFPTWPIITAHPEVQFYNWGLLPNWLRNQDPSKFAANTLNAKAETLSEKPSFQQLVDTKRCLIPSTGFFEYQTTASGKRSFFIQAHEQELFSFAGLYDTWREPQTGIERSTFTMITCAANELMAEIHNDRKRMPVILTREAENEWLLSGTRNLLVPASTDFLKAIPIDKKQMTTNNPFAQEYAAHAPIAEQGSLF